MKKMIIAIIVIATIVIAFTVFVFAKQDTKEKNLQDKVEQQISYLENKIILMMNHLNQIHFSNSVVVQENIDKNSENTQTNNESNESSKESSSNSSEKEQDSSLSKSSSKESESSENKQQSKTSEDNIQYEVKNNSILTNENIPIDWNYIKTSIEMLYSRWPTLIVDLHELNVKNEDILNFSTVLDKVTLVAKQEDKKATLNNLASLYAFLPNYRSQISKDSEQTNIDYTKACLLNAYNFVEQDNWEEVKKQLQNANYYFSNIMNRVEGNGQKQSHISKIYVSLNELTNSSNEQDKDLFFIKYRNSIEELMEF